MPTPKGPDGLTLKQRRFVQELPLAKSQTEAAIKAGYSSKGNTAAVKASQAVRNGNVQAALQAHQEAATSAKVMTLLKRKERLSKFAQDDPDHPDPMRAIDLLNRMDSIYVDRSEAKFAGVVVLEVRHFGGTPQTDTPPLTETAESPMPAYTPQKTKRRRKAQ